MLEGKKVEKGEGMGGKLVRTAAEETMLAGADTRLEGAL